MARTQTQNKTIAPAVLHARSHTQYLVMRQGEVWFIKFDGEEFGPYKTEREAMLFAIDAAHKLGGQGEETQVLRVDEAGKARTVWTRGRDSYPPKLQ